MWMWRPQIGTISIITKFIFRKSNRSSARDTAHTMVSATRRMGMFTIPLCHLLLCKEYFHYMHIYLYFQVQMLISISLYFTKFCTLLERWDLILKYCKLVRFHTYSSYIKFNYELFYTTCSFEKS